MAAFLIAAIRFVCVVSVNETGLDMVLTQWQNAAFGFIGLGHTSIGHGTPSRQADFWRGEVDRVVHDHPDSASLHMGAAWALDSPSIGFLGNHLRQSHFAQAFPQMGLELDENAISAEKTEFREKCIGKCLEMTEAATRIEPNHVRWWRMRALLLFEGDWFYSDQVFAPRDSNWLEVLNECRTHDPDNALYYYLAALQLWNTSASYDWRMDPGAALNSDEWGRSRPENYVDEGPIDHEDKRDWKLTIRDSNRFDLGVERFARAQQLPFLAIGEAGYASVAEFLASSHLRKADQAEIAISRLVTIRHSTLFGLLWRWQGVRADEARREDDPEEEMSILRQNLRLYDQAVAPKETSALSTLTTFGPLRQSTYEAVEKLAENHPTLIESSELESIRQREEEFRVESSTLQSALQNLMNESYPKEYAASWSAILTGVACASAAILLLAAGGLVGLATLISNRRDAGAHFDTLSLAVAWIIGFGATFVVLGLAPAEVISHGAQRKAALTGVWLAMVMIVTTAVVFVIRGIRRRIIRFRVISLFTTMTVVAVLAACWPLMAASYDLVALNPPELWLHATGWNDIDAEVLRTAMKAESGSLYWATIQWIAYGGIHVGLLVSLMLAALWFMWRSARQSERGFLSYWTQDIRVRWSALLLFVGRACLAVGMCFVFLYLCIIPSAIRLSEAEFQYQMSYCRNPESHWTEIREAQAAVRDSPEAIKAIREQVQFGMFGDGVLEQDFSGE